MRFSLLILSLLVLVSTSACMEADAPEATDAPAVAETGNAEDDPCPSLVGSWELVSIASDAPALTGEFESDPDYQEAPTLKILNDTHWMFIRQSSERFIFAQGGRYTLEKGTYTEHVEYSAVPENVGKSYEFECSLDGPDVWHHRGGMGDFRYDETWQRVE